MCILSEKDNDGIRRRIYDMYADFVKHVDPKGSVMDRLIQDHVVNPELAEQLRSKETRQDRCRAMLHELHIGGNPQAFIVLRTALLEDYGYIVDTIDKAASGTITLVTSSRCI